MAKYKIWAAWDNYRDGSSEFTDIIVCSSAPKPSSSGSAFYHVGGKALVYFKDSQQKLDFINKVCWLEPGECKTFEVEIDEI